MAMKWRRVITLLLLAASVGCSKGGDELLSGEGGEGDIVSMSIATRSGDTGSTTSDLLDSESSVLRITNSSGLIRRYSPASDAPSSLELTKGAYSAELYAGVQVEATWSSEELYYHGTKDFTVGTDASIEVAADMQNILVEVVFDESIANNFVEGYNVVMNYVDAASTSQSVSLTFDSDKSGDTGYFLIPAESQSREITWAFSGTTKSGVGNADTVVALDDTISDPEAAYCYKLTFKYTYSIELGAIGLTVDESSERYDDTLGFKIQPSVASSVVLDTGDEGETMSVNITTLIEDIAAVTVSDGTSTYILYGSGSTTLSGCSYTVNDGRSGTLTLDSSVFTTQTGLNTITVTAYDTDGVEGSGTIQLYCPGTIDPTDFNSWTMSATFVEVVTEGIGAGDVVQYQYREGDSGDWVDLETAVINENGARYITAKAAPTWSQITPEYQYTMDKDAQDVWTPSGGVQGGVTYESRLLINSVAYSESSVSFTDSDHEQIADANMDSSSLSCYGTSNSSSTGWGSGNYSLGGIDGLCTRVSMGDNYCAKLQATSPTIGTDLGAGNIFLGQFSTSISPTGGYVRFGQAFTWGARPVGFKVKYAASLGTVDVVTNGAGIDMAITKGGTDIARIFIAIVDWGSRHTTFAGTDGDPDDPFNPVDSPSSGSKVIGYASYFITANTASTSALTELYLPMYYHDSVTKPSSNIGIVVSCSSCAYGDYISGSTSSCIWVDDFELVYNY